MSNLSNKIKNNNMLDSQININNNIYYIEFLDNSDFKTDIYNEYCILTQYDNLNYTTLKNVMICDKDLLLNDRYLLTFPNTDLDNKVFSKNIGAFENLYIDDLYNVNIYSNNTCTNENILTNKVRLYHPQTLNNIDAIIYMNLYINGINIIIYCRAYNSLNVFGSTEINKFNNIYSEYKELNIPDINYLLQKCYIKDNGDIIKLSKLFQSYYKDENNIIHYLDNVDTNYKYPINISLIPYDSYDSTSEKFIISSTLLQDSNILASNIKISLTNKLGFDDNGIITTINKFNISNISDNMSDNEYNNVLKTYYAKINNVNLNNYDGKKYCQYNIVVASDINLTQIIYINSVKTDYPEKFGFALNNIFNSFEEMPDMIVAKVNFVDNYLGTVINSNIVPITKEWFKYMINSSAKSRINLQNNNLSFVNKINCIIKDNSNTNNSNSPLISQQNTPKIIYKPIFYRTNDLDTIFIKFGMLQNVGINLNEYMTKVESFSIVFDNGYTISEFARNNIYVIFKIDATKLNTSGIYNILTGDGDYISNGKYFMQ